MSKCIKWLDLIISNMLIFLMFCIVLAVSWQVFSRYILHAPSSGSEEFARFLLIWIGLLGAVYSYRTKSHLGLNIFTNKMPAKKKRLAELFSHSMVFIFSFCALVLGGSNLVTLTFNPVQTSASLGLSVGYIYTVLPISGVMFCIYSVNEMFILLHSNTDFDGEM